MQGNRSNIVAGNVFHTPVIPSEEDRSLVNDLRNREPALSDRACEGVEGMGLGHRMPLRLRIHGRLDGTLPETPLSGVERIPSP